MGDSLRSFVSAEQSKARPVSTDDLGDRLVNTAEDLNRRVKAYRRVLVRVVRQSDQPELVDAARDVLLAHGDIDEDDDDGE